jgi:separase
MEVEKLLDIPASGDMNEEMQPTVGLDSPVVDFVSFQAEYIDIIPETWTVLSISINENRDELRLARLRANQAPFILTIPLHRHNSRDLDEEIFGFDEGKEELLNVISLANYSTHDAVDASRKDAKIAWWEARKALDARLKDLLTNIENIWLGGFRGIFEQRVPPQNLLSRFQQSFYNILEKHLPSRRKGAKGTKQSRVSLDSRVLELFTGLGKPAKVEYVEEPLTDLLFFVVDILQFHGERNAYDEIDFDSIVVETMDALTQFHEALQDRYEGAEQTHAVLILDKSLHCFPWESLPCMAGRSVSRLPSLGCLRTRILRQPEPKTAGQLPGLYADPTDGAYVLNPAGDLASTQKTFMEPLAALGTWSATVNAAPSEAELVSHLASRSLYLYFGHGCGGQYIRARAIKRLEGCAVALLMGCSSGALTEAGEYESYGTPINYLQAGSAAVVGTLWDVTDKDIDRFSMTVLERWGLFEHEAAASPAMARGSPAKRDRKGKGKEFLCRGKVSLDQAVAEGRSSCILKHLNGAAPVVYGVPVYLSP